MITVVGKYTAVRGFDKMVSYADANQEKKLGILTCKLLNGDGSLQKSVNRFYSFWRSFIENRFFEGIFQKLNLKGGPFLSFWDHNEEREIDWAFGAVMLFSKDLMDEIGMLDERFYIYAEEMDYFMRARKAGYHSWFIPNIEIIHFGKSSSRQRRAAMFIQNYKSFYLFLEKHYSKLDNWLYRGRTWLYLFGWYTLFSLRRGEEARVQREVYRETIRWHFSR